VPVDFDATGEAVLIQPVWSRVVRWTGVFLLEWTFASKFLFIGGGSKAVRCGPFESETNRAIRLFHSTVTQNKEQAWYWSTSTPLPQCHTFLLLLLRSMWLLFLLQWLLCPPQSTSVLHPRLSLRFPLRFPLLFQLLFQLQ